MTRGFLPLLGLVVAAGIATLGWGTAGFRVVTSEGARRLAVERAPRPVPDVLLIDQDGAPFSLAAYRGRPLLVEFIYTSCPTICGVLGDAFRRVVGTAGQTELLSISFDPAHDGPRELKDYGERFGAAAPAWRVAVPATADGLHALLQTFGVVAIPDTFGGFTHNAAVYLLDRHLRLVRILDPDLPAGAIASAVDSVS